MIKKYGKNGKQIKKLYPEKGMDIDNSSDNLCSKINKLVNIVNQKDKENEKLIKKLYSDIARNVPSSMARIINIKYIQVNIIKAEEEIKTNEDDDLL